MYQVLRSENGPRCGVYVKILYAENLVQILDQETRPVSDLRTKTVFECQCTKFRGPTCSRGNTTRSHKRAHAIANRTPVCSPVMHRVSPSVACHTNTQVCTPCVACRDDAMNVCDTRTSARRDDMVVERSQEHARPCGAMTSDGHMCMIARLHVRTSCGCPILPRTGYMLVHDTAQNKQRPVMMHESDIQHLRILSATI